MTAQRMAWHGLAIVLGLIGCACERCTIARTVATLKAQGKLRAYDCPASIFESLPEVNA